MDMFMYISSRRSADIVYLYVIRIYEVGNISLQFRPVCFDVLTGIIFDFSERAHIGLHRKGQKCIFTQLQAVQAIEVKN